MTKVISFATQKGGAGKTTLLMLTASAIHNRTGKKVLVMDSDPQQSVKTIYKKEQELNKNTYDVFAFNWNQPTPEENFEKTLILAKRKYDVILMDVPGHIKSIELYYSILASDTLIVPIVASLLDINATVSFLNMVEEMQRDLHAHLRVFGVINKRDKTIEHHLIQKLSGKAGMSLFSTPISNLARYKRNISTANEIIDAKYQQDEFNLYFQEFSKHCL